MRYFVDFVRYFVDFVRYFVDLVLYLVDLVLYFVDGEHSISFRKHLLQNGFILLRHQQATPSGHNDE